jgi:hypothetical protein
MYDDSQLTMNETTLLGHVGGNLVMRDRSQGLLISNTISVCVCVCVHVKLLAFVACT